MSGRFSVVLFGRRLRAARTAIGYDVAAFAEELNLSVHDYQAIERGAEPPDLDTLVYISRITGKSLDFLLTGQSHREC